MPTPVSKFMQLLALFTEAFSSGKNATPKLVMTLANGTGRQVLNMDKIHEHLRTGSAPPPIFSEVLGDTEELRVTLKMGRDLTLEEEAVVADVELEEEEYDAASAASDFYLFIALTNDGGEPVILGGLSAVSRISITESRLNTWEVVCGAIEGDLTPGTVVKKDQMFLLFARKLDLANEGDVEMLEDLGVYDE